MQDLATKSVAEAPPSAPSGLTVLYDGACPLCRREIALYQGLTSSEPICYLDVSVAGPVLDETANAVSRETLLARFHVRDSGGRLHSGARAFVALWAVLPGWRWLARIAAWPGVTMGLEWVYRGFLRVRPAMQWAVMRWDARRRPRQ